MDMKREDMHGIAFKYHVQLTQSTRSEEQTIAEGNLNVKYQDTIPCRI